MYIYFSEIIKIHILCACFFVCYSLSFSRVLLVNLIKSSNTSSVITSIFFSKLLYYVFFLLFNLFYMLYVDVIFLLLNKLPSNFDHAIQKYIFEEVHAYFQ